MLKKTAISKEIILLYTLNHSLIAPVLVPNSLVLIYYLARADLIVLAQFSLSVYLGLFNPIYPI